MDKISLKQFSFSLVKLMIAVSCLLSYSQTVLPDFIQEAESYKVLSTELLTVANTNNSSQLLKRSSLKTKLFFIKSCHAISQLVILSEEAQIEIYAQPFSSSFAHASRAPPVYV